MTINIIVQGLGRGTNLAQVVKESKQLNLSAVIDPKQERLDATQKICKLDKAQLFTNFPAAIKNASVDLLIIATPTKFHYEHIMAGLEKGLHILCEKPLVTNSKELEKIKQKADSKNLRVAAIQNMRFAPQFIKCRELVQKGAIGKISNIEINYNRWRPPAGLEHALLYNHGVHHIDVIRSICKGEANYIDALEWDPVWTKNSFGSGRCLRMTVFTKGGWAAIYNGSYAETGLETPHTGIIKITGSEGTIIASGEADIKPVIKLFSLERATGIGKNETIPVPPQTWASFDKIILEGFTNAIDRKISWETDIIDNSKTLTWLFAAEKSILEKPEL